MVLRPLINPSISLPQPRFQHHLVNINTTKKRNAKTISETIKAKNELPENRDQPATHLLNSPLPHYFPFIIIIYPYIRKKQNKGNKGVMYRGSS